MSSEAGGREPEAPRRRPARCCGHGRAGARGARAGARSLLELQGGRGAQDARGRDRHRLQHRERLLRPDDVRRARGRVQGRLRGPRRLRRDRGRRRLEAAHPALRPLPADPVGVLRRHRRCTWWTRRGARATLRLRELLPLPFDGGTCEHGRRASRWARLPTESRNPRSRGSTRCTTERVVALLLDEDRRALAAATRERRAIARAARLARRRARAPAATSCFLGAGTSGRLGVLEAAECPPTFGTDPRRIRAVMAGGDASVFRSPRGRRGPRRRGPGARARRLARRRPAGRHLGELGDARSCAARSRGARARGAQHGPRHLRPGPRPARLADVVVVASRSGPEVLTGSTRLKAGSATKAALNAITTAAMVRLGKVYENLMVDLQADLGQARRPRPPHRRAAAGRSATREAARLLAEPAARSRPRSSMARLGVPGRRRARRRRPPGMSAGRCAGPGARRTPPAALAAVDDDVPQVAVLLVVVEAVADHELVLDREADVVHVDAHQPPRGLGQQRRDLQRAGPARLQQVDQVVQRQARCRRCPRPRSGRGRPVPGRGP